MIPHHRWRRRIHGFDTADTVVWVMSVDEFEALQRLGFVPPGPVEAKGGTDTPRLPLEHVLAEERRGLELLEQRVADPFMAGDATMTPPIPARIISRKG